MYDLATFDRSQCLPRVMHQLPLSLPFRNVLEMQVYGMIFLTVLLKSVFV